MKKSLKFALGIALSFAVSMSYADNNNTSANVSGTNTNQSQSTSANEGVSTNINSYGSPDNNIHYSGVTGANASIGLGSFSSSFSSDYCGGTAQAGFSAPYVTLAAGKPVLGDPGEACVKTRTAIHTFEMAVSYGTAATLASKTGNTVEAAMYQGMSQKLSTAAVSILCNVSADVKQAYESAGISCAKTAKEEQAAQKASADQKAQQAMALGQPVDPLVRERIGLPPLASK